MSSEYYDFVAADVFKKISLKTKKRKREEAEEEVKEDEGTPHFRFLLEPASLLQVL